MTKNWENAKVPLNIIENCSFGLKYAFSGRMEIHPCVLQDIGPLGPLPCSHSTSSANHSKQGIGYRWPCAILGWLVVYGCVWRGCGLGCGLGWGAEGGWMPLPTHPQRCCDPASLVSFRNDILTKWGVKLKSLSKLTQTSANFGHLLLCCFSTDLDEIYDEMKDFLCSL